MKTHNHPIPPEVKDVIQDVKLLDSKNKYNNWKLSMIGEYEHKKLEIFF